MLIIIEGVDGSGKQTHVGRLYKRLTAEGKAVREIHFPDYNSDTSALVKMYLGGAFGEKPEAVSPYVASSFYAVDRIASYLAGWKADYERGGIIIADRYTTSNAVHQGAKLEGSERDRYLDWLFDFEYNVLRLPKPDLVVMLDMPPECGEALIKNRDNKITGGSAKDIHEKNKSHLDAAYRNALYTAEKYGWKIVRCISGGVIRPIDEINDEIYHLIRLLAKPVANG